jgi:hypothetical protein
LKKSALVLAVLALSPAMAMADTTVNGKISTLGLGAEAAFPVTQSIDARIGVNTFNYNFNKSIASGTATTNYNGKLDLQSLQALADWHPMAGSFRVSGGLVYNNNKFNMTALPGAGSTFDVGGTARTISAGESVNASVDFNKVAPYLGIGWGRTPKNSGLSFTSDFGILFQGSPKGNVTTNVAGASAADIARANTDLNSSLKNFKMYPVVSIGIGYTF